MRLRKKSLQSQEKEKNSKFSPFWLILILLGAIVYTISPWDIIPDLLGPLGLTDDIILWAVIIGKGLAWFFQRK
ncbi:MAG TPA: DUF1232 domain-containing protein [Desulfohalobiaceae bacterium]|nr:DUF1232 domain-containing protein [Desulfohalobiaceae bacterium]